MSKLQRDPTSKKINRNSQTKKCVNATASDSCCCSGCPCNGRCVRFTITGSVVYDNGTDPPKSSPFVGVWTVPFAYSTFVGFCTYFSSCTIDFTGADDVHYTSMDLAVTLGMVDGYLVVYGIGITAYDDAGGLLEFPGLSLSNPITADGPGCGASITWTPGVDDPTHFPNTPSDVSVKFEFIPEENCEPFCEPTGCMDVCCPDATCVEGKLTLTFTDGDYESLGSIELNFSTPIGAISIPPTTCYSEIVCFSEFVDDDDVSIFTNFSFLLQHYCDGSGNLRYRILKYGSFDQYQEGTSVPANYFYLDPQTESDWACGDTVTSPDFDVTDFFGVVVGSGTLEFSIKESCTTNLDCGFQPPTCPEDCFTCNEECGKRCWVGSVLTIGSYTIGTGECGVCVNGGATGDDGCGRCCENDGHSGGATGICNNSWEKIECEANGYVWWCQAPCVGFPGQGISPCSFIDFSGTDLQLPFGGVIDGNPHFAVTLTGGGNVITFDIWFNCTDGRWYARITFNTRCVFEGDINGGCTSFSTIELAGTDSSIGGSSCVMLLGTLTDGTVDFANYICSEE